MGELWPFRSEPFESKLKVLSRKLFISDPLIESIKYVHAHIQDNNPLSCCRAHSDTSLWWRAGHHMAIIIPALDTGFKMCQWRVIVTVINVISRTLFFFFYNVSILSSAFIDHRNVFMEIRSLCFCPHEHLFSLLFPGSIFPIQNLPFKCIITNQTSFIIH